MRSLVSLAKAFIGCLRLLELRHLSLCSLHASKAQRSGKGSWSQRHSKSSLRRKSGYRLHFDGLTVGIALNIFSGKDGRRARKLRQKHSSLISVSRYDVNGDEF